ncbi:uncharacterized protein MYCFIDRAFT_169330 [Pseudocercospora fijiensis CIRAD86]|uniref:Uncharacterized protein n=1 Tax=Pseudocercospora fijiensis (strain CIRAD86) TaxID=383855 RepID=N1Q9F2_PSEFD|nr:uncharacterized protein MYCFIDRAFT_169330 [Pseudocercospora fijiensis CIRAD86]EME87518.1 hypothetical protein MYCFIDRAFT_169330 [Pseudocercospora fijiensis CIRAD86]
MYAYDTLQLYVYSSTLIGCGWSCNQAYSVPLLAFDFRFIFFQQLQHHGSSNRDTSLPCWSSNLQPLLPSSKFISRTMIIASVPFDYHIVRGTLRIGPNELSFADSRVWKDVCAHRPEFQMALTAFLEHLGRNMRDFDASVFDVIGELAWGESFHGLEERRVHDWVSAILGNVKYGDFRPGS